MIKLHLDALGYDLDELAELLHINPNELPAFHGFSPGGAGRNGPRLRIVD